MDGVALKTWCADEARRLGFDAFGVTTPDAIPHARPRLEMAIADGHHAGMTWLADTADRRGDPRALWPDVRSVIVVGHNYGPEHNPLENLANRRRAVISAYAKGRDYHDVIKGRLKQLAGGLAARAGDGADVKVFVDTAPVMEKPLAAAAGLGWQGKHTNLVSRAHGSWLFLGVIMTTAVLPADTPEADHCGTCRRCLDICPTDAFPAPYRLDARQCLAYWSIEHKGQIPNRFREPMGNRVFGCDDCLAVCPWNKFAQTSRELRYAANAATDDPPIADILSLDDASFRKRYAGSPIKRTGRDRIVRNALVAAGNAAAAELEPGLRPRLTSELKEPVARLLDDESPLVRGMAIWALARIDRNALPANRAETEARLAHENDASVRGEWLALVTRADVTEPEE